MGQQFYYEGEWISSEEMRKISEKKAIRKLTGYVEDPDRCPYCDNMEEHDREECKENSDLISIVIPSREEEEIYSMKSINEQTYQNIEVIVEYDYQKEGSSVMRNKGFKKSKGKYVFFCDNDVDLVPDCLEMLWKEIKKTKAPWVYGQIVIDGKNITGDKSNKPHVNNRIAFAYHYFCVSTMSLIDSSIKPEWDESFRRFNDWDLWLTLEERGYPGHFLNKILLTTENRKDGISRGGKKDEQEALKKLFDKHIVTEKLADIIIPHHNRHDHLKRCLEGIDNRIFNIIVVSGGTFAENCNKGARVAQTSTLIFLNDDVETNTEMLVNIASDDSDYTGTSQFIDSYKYYGIGLKFDSIEDGWTLTHQPEDNSVPSGYCMKFKKSAWEKLEGLNEEFKNGGEDIDIGLRAIKVGLKVGYVDFPMVHHHSQSEGRFTYAGENRLLLAKLWDINQVNKLLCRKSS